MVRFASYFSWACIAFIIALAFFCSPEKDITVHEEIWIVSRIDTIYRHNDRNESVQMASVVFKELKNETEYTLHVCFPTRYKQGERVITFNR